MVEMSLETSQLTESPISPQQRQQLDLADIVPASDDGIMLIPIMTNSDSITKKWNRSFARESSGKERPYGRGIYPAVLRNSQEWVDLELLLRELTDSGTSRSC